MAKPKSRLLKHSTFIRKSGLHGGGLELFKAITSKGVGFPSTGDGLDIPKVTGKNKQVVILGGGLAGLTCAYEFLKEKKTEHQVTILEATNRVGGRSLTLRPGDSFTEKVGRTTYTQTCDFESEQLEPYPPYLNAGPGRIPSAHRNVLNYCKELNVELQVYIMQTRSNRLYSDTSLEKKKLPKSVNWQNRRIANDTRGFIAQYLYNRVDTIKDLNEQQKTELRSLLIDFGKLSADHKKGMVYSGSSRSGYTVLPNVISAGDVIEPIPFKDLLNSAFWKLAFYQPEDFLWQETSFQPVGGMDMIEKAFEKEIIKMAGHIRLESKVKSIKPHGKGYMITYQRGLSRENIYADICISNIPIPLLRGKINPGIFSAKYGKALETVINTKDFLQPTCKVGWQADRRLWQDPSDQNDVPIFGGISYTSDPMTQMWYPSDNFHANLGVLTGAYNYTKNAIAWGKLPPEERLELAKKEAEHLHGKAFAKGLKKGISIAWQNIPTQKGGWVSWGNVSGGTDTYNTLIKGDKNFYITGDQVSHLPGWKEGAIASALNVFAQVAQVKGYVAPKIVELPDTAALVHPGF